MLYREIIPVCSEIHTKHTNTLCGQNIGFLNVELGGTYINHWTVSFVFAFSDWSSWHAVNSCKFDR
jgi:hypothetical protein